MLAAQRLKKHITKGKQKFAVESLNKLNLPNSILIIPDGNGRWAKKHNVDIKKGHEKGASSIEKILEHFLKLDTQIIGIWGFSEDNWKRSNEEIKNIMAVVEQTIDSNLKKLIQNKVRFMFLGNIEIIEVKYPELFKKINNAIQKTKTFEEKTLALFLDYGERFQLEEFAKARENDKKTPTYELLSKINGGLPLFDMVLRTSGEKRISGFGPLAELAEFVFAEKNLPDLNDRDIAKALIEYSKRQRRFGGRST